MPAGGDHQRASSGTELLLGAAFVVGIVILALGVILWLTVPNLFGPHGTQPAPGYSPSSLELHWPERDRAELRAGSRHA
jgi:hypothetical protein